MTDLEKLINDLLEIPSIDLEGDEDTVTAQWASSSDGSTAFIKLGEWSETIYLDPSQALSLLSWLQGQKDNLARLQDALQAKQVEDEATKSQREAERFNALKALHSDAVVAWQQGGSVGPCPSFEEIANPKVEFIMKFPCLERLRQEAFKDTAMTTREEAERVAKAAIAPYAGQGWVTGRIGPIPLPDSDAERLDKAIKEGRPFLFMGSPSDTMQDIEKLRESANAEQDDEDAYFATGFPLSPEIMQNMESNRDNAELAKEALYLIGLDDGHHGVESLEVLREEQEDSHVKMPAESGEITVKVVNLGEAEPC